MNRILQNFCCLGSKYILSSDESRSRDDDVSTKKSQDRLNDSNVVVKVGVDADDKNGNSTEITKFTYKVSQRCWSIPYQQQEMASCYYSVQCRRSSP